MNKYIALVRLYYLVDGKKTCAPANTIAFDFPEDEVEAALSKGYIRKATVGEIAEGEASRPVKETKKRAAKADKKADAGKADAGKADAGAADAGDDAGDDKKPDNDLA